MPESIPWRVHMCDAHGGLAGRPPAAAAACCTPGGPPPTAPSLHRPSPPQGQSGNAVQYLTRNQALKKLQLKLSEFRRLCILKGIHPREPKKKPQARGAAAARRQPLCYC